jgi:hypothetical protein
MSKKSDQDQQLAQEAEARKQGDKTAREESAGRGDQTLVGERGGQAAVDQLHERQQYDSQNRPTEDKGRIDRHVEDIQRDQEQRANDPNQLQRDVTIADATGERQPTTVHPDGTTTTQPPQTTQGAQPRSLAEGGVHPRGETP